MTRSSPHPWYTGKADEAGAFYASKVEPGKHIGRLNVLARIGHRGDIRPETEGSRAQPNAWIKPRREAASV